MINYLIKLFTEDYNDRRKQVKNCDIPDVMPSVCVHEFVFIEGTRKNVVICHKCGKEKAH